MLKQIRCLCIKEPDIAYLVTEDNLEEIAFLVKGEVLEVEPFRGVKFQVKKHTYVVFPGEYIVYHKNPAGSNRFLIRTAEGFDALYTVETEHGFIFEEEIYDE